MYLWVLRLIEGELDDCCPDNPNYLECTFFIHCVEYVESYKLDTGQRLLYLKSAFGNVRDVDKPEHP
jgi:hypothetical protein